MNVSEQLTRHRTAIAALVTIAGIVVGAHWNHRWHEQSSVGNSKATSAPRQGIDVRMSKPGNTDSGAQRPAMNSSAGVTAAPARDASEVGVAPTVDLSVMGQSFPMSKEVEEMCSRPPQRDFAVCDVRQPVLRRFTGEPRQDTWADTMEERIRALLQNNPTLLANPHIECRTTVCLAETSSRMDWHSYDLFDDFRRASGFFFPSRIVAAGPVDDSGEQSVHVVYIFERRSGR